MSTTEGSTGARRGLHALSLDRLRDDHGWDVPANPTVADTTDTPILHAIAARLTPAQIAAWEAVAYSDGTNTTAAQLLGKQPAAVRQLMVKVRRAADHTSGRSARRSRRPSQEDR